MTIFEAPMSQPFPPDLLHQPPADRLAWFRQKVIRHPHLDTAFQSVQDAIRAPAGATLILVIGATGIGKTTLRLRLERQLITDAQTRMASDPAHMPVVSVEAIAPEQGTFNWRDYYLRALQALEEPLLDEKRAAPHAPRHPRQRPTTATLRRALEQCLQQRRPTAFLIDEAQHLKKVGSGRRLLDQMDTLKSLAQTTQTLHVLFGTYDLLTLTNLSAQLGRRSREIHVPRYHLDQADEHLAFRNVLYTFQQALPLPEPPDLVGQVEQCYAQSAGCVGVLKDWLNRALALALDAAVPTLTPAVLAQASLALPTRLQLAREIQTGEAAFVTTAQQQAELHALLGIPPADAVGTPASRAHRAGRRQQTRDTTSDAAEEPVC
jgi:hypothetical protein